MNNNNINGLGLGGAPHPLLNQQQRFPSSSSSAELIPFHLPLPLPAQLLSHQTTPFPPQPQQSVIVHTLQQQQQMIITGEEGREEDEEIGGGMMMKDGRKGRERRKRTTKRRSSDDGRGQAEKEANDDEDDGRGRMWGKERRKEVAEAEEMERNGQPLNESPEATGVRKYISPFAPEATIPLPHQLEQTAHGTTVWKRNERERQRVRNLNDGYAQLREELPMIDRDRRMSKVDSLRLAIAYIRHLELLLRQGNAHWTECECFRQSYGSGGDGSSAENTPPPQN